MRPLGPMISHMAQIGPIIIRNTRFGPFQAVVGPWPFLGLPERSPGLHQAGLWSGNTGHGPRSGPIPNINRLVLGHPKDISFDSL